MSYRDHNKRVNDQQNNPQGDPERKPYDFVPLPDHTKAADELIAGHHTVTGSSATPLLSGHITAIIVSESLVHIASGMVMLIEDIEHVKSGGSDIDATSIRDDELIMSHVRTNNVRIIPGSTLKGLIRSFVEAITNPGVTLVPKEPFGKKQTQVTVRTQELAKTPILSEISLANRLFGLTYKNQGYQGQCSFYDARQLNGGAQVFRRLPLYSPQPYKSQTNQAPTDYRLYFTSAARNVFRGRKFYRAGITREAEPPYTAVEACKTGSTFAFEMVFHNISRAELGIILLVLGIKGTNDFQSRIPRLKVGGGKPVSMGTIRFTGVSGEIITSDAYIDFDATSQPLDDLSIYIDDVYKAGVIFEDGLNKLTEIMTNSATYSPSGKGKERNY